MNYATKHMNTSVCSSCDMTSGFVDSICHLNSYQRDCLSKLIHISMVHGKKSQSHTIILKTLNQLSSYGDAIHFVMTAIDNVKPVLEVKKVRISGNTQLVPAVISKHRQQTLAIRWLLEAAVKRRNAKRKLHLEQCLSLEIVDAFNKIGSVRQKRDELHKLAENNRAFAHYRWW